MKQVQVTQNSVSKWIIIYSPYGFIQQFNSNTSRETATIREQTNTNTKLADI